VPVDFTLIDAEDFELLCEDLLRTMGFVIEASVARGPDLGKDIVASLTIGDPAGFSEMHRYLIECKHYIRSGRSVLEENLGSPIARMGTHKCDRYILATSTIASEKVRVQLDAIPNTVPNYKAIVWSRGDLNRLLDQHPEVRARFFPSAVPQLLKVARRLGSPLMVRCPPEYGDYEMVMRTKQGEELVLLSSISFAAEHVEDLPCIQLFLEHGKPFLRIPVIADYREDRLYRLEERSSPTEYLVRSHETGERMALTTFLEKVPPLLFVGSWAVIIGKDYRGVQEDYRALAKQREPVILPPTSLQVWDWRNVDITCESQPVRGGAMSIHEATELTILKSQPRPTFVIKDHGAGEIADYIAIYDIEGRKEIGIFHCRGSRLPEPGARIADIYELVGQGIRSVNWISKSGLFTELLSRVSSDRRPRTELKVGDIKTLKRLAHLGAESGYNYVVYLVQPGLSISKACKNPRISPLLVNCYEWLEAYGVTLRVVGSA
jgi:hypothetical protein